MAGSLTHSLRPDSITIILEPGKRKVRQFSAIKLVVIITIIILFYEDDIMIF